MLLASRWRSARSIWSSAAASSRHRRLPHLGTLERRRRQRRPRPPRAHRRQPRGGEGGWWEPLIGPGRALDTDRAFVICANILGGCQGSTGPASIDPLTGRPYAMRFPLITIGDMVNAQRALVERLGVRKLVAIGGSIGGFQALEWATRHPDLVSGVVPVAATGALDAQGIAINEVGRRAIMADPDWRGGEYAAEGVFPAAGWRSRGWSAMVDLPLEGEHGPALRPQPGDPPGLYPSFGRTFDVEGYLHYHGEALVAAFDANSHLYLTRAMDLYDVGRDGGERRWLRQIAAPVLLVGHPLRLALPAGRDPRAGRPAAWPRQGRRLPRSWTRRTVTTPSSRSGTR